jgi:hypothetical protein
MKLTEEQLNAIEELAGFFMQPTEIAIIIEVDEFEFLEELKNKDSFVYKNFHKGILKSVVKLRKTQLDFALKGSQSNFLQMENYLKQLIINL